MSDCNEFAELLWENGQAVVLGRRKQPQPAFPPFGCGGTSSNGLQEKHPGAVGDTMAPFAKTDDVFGAMGMAPSIHDFASGLHATQANGEDDTVPWIHYPIVDDDNTGPALTTDYCSDFFSELQEAAAAAATANLGSLPPSTHNATNNRCTPIATTSRPPSKEIHGLPAPTTRTSEPQSELAAASAKQPRTTGSGEGVMNFSLFSRPAALARASLQRPQGTDKASNLTASNRMESTVVQSVSGPRSGAPLFTDQRAIRPQQKEVRFASAAAQTAAAGKLQQEIALDKASNKNTAVHRDATRKAPEPTMATSSVCSGNGVLHEEPWHQQKRKIQVQAESSASQDEDLEDEPGVLRRSANRRMKRSRTAEVHNLSERRRRDRINEKMRALQELIPNCNKIDKASMLDEAIEYLKTLQLQVQMMSMGTGLCIPPMLLPPAMQHLQIPSMAHFAHLGMGLGYGLGVFDMNSNGTIPMPAMPGAHFPCPMIPGAAPQGLGIPGANAMAMFGVPGQAIPSSASSVPPFASLSGLPVRPNLAPQVTSAMANTMQEQQGIWNQQQHSLNKDASQGANTDTN